MISRESKESFSADEKNVNNHNRFRESAEVILDTCQGFKQVRSKFYPRFIQADVKKPLKTRFFLDKLKCQKLKKQGLTKKVETL